MVADIEDDPTEENDLSSTNLQVVQELTAALQRFNASQIDQSTPKDRNAKGEACGDGLSCAVPWLQTPSAISCPGAPAVKPAPPPSPPSPAPPPEGCVAQLGKDGCEAGREQACESCAEKHQSDLKAAGCTTTAVKSYCTQAPPKPSRLKSHLTQAANWNITAGTIALHGWACYTEQGPTVALSVDGLDPQHVVASGRTHGVCGEATFGTFSAEFTAAKGESFLSGPHVVGGDVVLDGGVEEPLGGTPACIVNGKPATCPDTTATTTTSDPSRLKMDDLVATFSALDSPGARPATRAVAGLLNGGPEFGNKFLDPLRMGNYRGNACRNRRLYEVLERAGVRNVQCDVGQWLNCTADPETLQNTSACEVWPGRDGDWRPYEALTRELVKTRLGPKVSFGVWNEPNAGWPSCRRTNGCGTPPASWLEVWRRTVLQIRAIDKGATIVGPSIAGFNMTFMAGFVDFSVANDVVPTMLDWHEFGQNGSEIPAHHATMRRWLSVHHPSLAKIPIGHGETISEPARLMAGHTLGVIAGLERAGAAFSVHSTWGPEVRGFLPSGHRSKSAFILTERKPH